MNLPSAALDSWRTTPALVHFYVQESTADTHPPGLTGHVGRAGAKREVPALTGSRTGYGDAEWGSRGWQ
jgi:hypothetical protein